MKPETSRPLQWLVVGLCWILSALPADSCGLALLSAAGSFDAHVIAVQKIEMMVQNILLPPELPGGLCRHARPLTPTAGERQ